MTDLKFETELVALNRLPNSQYGNPRFELVTKHGVFRTLTDGAVNYGIENGNPVGKRVELTTTHSGAVVGLEIAVDR